MDPSATCHLLAGVGDIGPFARYVPSVSVVGTSTFPNLPPPPQLPQPSIALHRRSCSIILMHHPWMPFRFAQRLPRRKVGRSDRRRYGIDGRPTLMRVGLREATGRHVPGCAVLVLYL